MKEFNENMNKVVMISIISSLLFIVLGAVIIIYPEETISIISYILGGIMLIIGLINIIKFFKTINESEIFNFTLLYGVLSMLMSLLFFFRPFALAIVLQISLSIWIIITSIVKTQFTINLRKHNDSNWIISLILGIFTFILGIILLLNPFASVIALTKLIGILIIIYAIIDIIDSIIVKVSFNKIKKSLK